MIDELYNGFKKAEVLNKNISKELIQNVVGIYKRSSNILKSEISKIKLNYLILSIADYLRMILKKSSSKNFRRQENIL